MQKCSAIMRADDDYVEITAAAADMTVAVNEDVGGGSGGGGGGSENRSGRNVKNFEFWK